MPLSLLLSFIIVFFIVFFARIIYNGARKGSRLATNPTDYLVAALVTGFGGFFNGDSHSDTPFRDRDCNPHL